jgi:hypothetical protein
MKVASPGPRRSAPRPARGMRGSPLRARHAARRGLALTELLLALPVFFFIVFAIVRLAQAQGILVPAHHAARYSAWTQAALAAAPASRPPSGLTDEDARLAAHAPAGAATAVEVVVETEGESVARRIAPLYASIFAADLARTGRAVATARVREGADRGARFFPAGATSARVVVPVGCGGPSAGAPAGGASPRTGWMPALGEGPARVWSRAFGSE